MTTYSYYFQRSLKGKIIFFYLKQDNESETIVTKINSLIPSNLQVHDRTSAEQNPTF